MKYFPFMPGEKETGKLVLAILFYYFVAGYVGAIMLPGIFAITVLLAPLSIATSVVASAYMVAGIVFAIFAYKGKQINIG